MKIVVDVPYDKYKEIKQGIRHLDLSFSSIVEGEPLSTVIELLCEDIDEVFGDYEDRMYSNPELEEFANKISAILDRHHERSVK